MSRRCYGSDRELELEAALAREAELIELEAFELEGVALADELDGELLAALELEAA